MCTKGAEWNHRQKVEEEYHTGTALYFQAYRQPLEAMNYFKYLGRVLTVSYDDCPEVVGNLGKALKSCKRLESILGWEDANPRVSVIFFSIRWYRWC